VSESLQAAVLYLLAGDFDSTAGTARTDNITQTSKD
jgi:hypothetical protein